MADLEAQSGSRVPPFPLVAPVRAVVDDYYGNKVSDPYRFMENLNDPEVQAWMKAQNDYTAATLAGIPGRAKLLARIRELGQSTPGVWARRLPGDLYLILKALPNENVSKIYLRRGLDGSDKLIVDPEKITLAPESQGKGKNAVTYCASSWDVKYLAVNIAPGGSDRDTEVHVIETDSRRETGDVIRRAEMVNSSGGAPNWLPDNRSFVYGQNQKLPPGAPVTQLYQKYRSYLHVLGTDPEKDAPVFGYGVSPSIPVDPRHLSYVSTSPGSKYVLGIIDTGVSPNREFYIAPVEAIGKSNNAWRKVADFSDDVADVAIHGDDLYLRTFKDAPRYKVILTSARKPDLTSAETIVPQSQGVVIWVHAVQDAVYVELADGGISRVLRVPYGPRPKAQEIVLPFNGRAYLITDPRLAGGLLNLTSWTQAYTIYAYNPATSQVTDTKLQPAGPFDHPSDVESEEVKVRSGDGTLVPLSILHRKGLKRDESSPTWLWGYGAYGHSLDASFSPELLAWTEMGGVWAVCHVRGGGEYGEEWHLAGKGPTKPNTWRDFIACAEYLVQQNYTSPSHLAGEGASAGGILIGRAITERPDLFGAAIIDVGMSDALRNETTANGVPNIAEFGSTKTEQGFRDLYAMSAYHHVKDGTAYPAILLTTGINDPRVDPWQSAKMTARLQAATTSGKPVLLRVDYSGGHGSSGIEQLVDEWSFVLWQSGVSGFQPQLR